MLCVQSELFKLDHFMTIELGSRHDLILWKRTKQLKQ